MDRLESVLFANSTTLGVRVHDVHKHMLPRQSRSVSTSLGDVMVKIATLPNGGKRWKVEHDDVVRIAEQSGREYLNVRALLDEEVAAKLKEETGT